jgi:hypothetical protein
MLPLYVLLVLAGVGYYINKTSVQYKKYNHVVPTGEMPSMNTIYNSQYTQRVDQEMAQRNNDAFKSGVSMNYALNNENQGTYSALAGVEIPSFSHNNMVPFFGGSVKQNTKAEMTQSLLETYTGAVGLRQPKREVESFGDLQQNAGNVYGMGSESYELQLSRMNTSHLRNNELPFEKEYVGPGLNQGYSSLPTGGFQQADSRDYAMPKNVDDLRVLTKPKLTFEGRIVDGVKSALPGEMGEMAKNRVETFYENSPDRYFTTVGAVKGETQQGEMMLKNTTRPDTTAEFKGGAFVPTASKNRAEVQAPLRQNLSEYGVRNATTVVKVLAAPWLDLARLTTRENTTESSRAFGNVSAQIPEKLTIYDPNDIARTTIKETTVHDTHTGNLKGLRQSYHTYDPEDVSRTTMRQTLIDGHDGNMDGKTRTRGGYETAEYDARTTHRETTDTEYQGNVYIRDAEGGYKVQRFDPKITQRTSTSEHDHFGVAQSQNDKQMSYDDMYNANIDNTKELTLQNRVPTKTSVKVAGGRDGVNMQYKKLECDANSTRALNNKNKIVNAIPSTMMVQMTQDRKSYFDDDRLDSSLLNAFRENPYTHPLNSVA